MVYRIEIAPVSESLDAKGQSVKKLIKDFFDIDIDKVITRDVYTVSADISDSDAEKIGLELANPVLQSYTVGESQENCDFLISVGFKPGVTDNVGRTAHEAVGDIIGRKLHSDEFVFSSKEFLITGSNLTKETVHHIAVDLLANELIETVRIFDKKELMESGIPDNLPLVKGTSEIKVNEYNLEVADDELMEISRKGVLALSLGEMKVIQNYFRQAVGRGEIGLTSNPTDVELEVLAQTWSEHCKHKIFDAVIEYEDENGEKETIVSCYKSFIKKSTHEIAEEINWLVSVFHDNAGVIKYNDKFDLAYKVETHNSPSALDPYGGAMTGIVGVNRDPMGTGRGADLLINVWGYCLGSPFTSGKDVPEGLLHPRRLRDGIHKGVIDGGNQSGIPYGLGWEYFQKRYLGKPLVFCGTLGLLPCMIGDTPGHEKEIHPGDLIVMAGGRIGKDGIHGATFSSEELHGDSPLHAVQIGDPITQKKMSDFIYEIREKDLYRFITDNGAGGLSSSIGEMAEHSGGCRMDLAKAPLKYDGLQPWEILVSEAQERMSFAVPQENIDEFMKIAEARDVEVSVLGEFTDSGKFHILYDDETVAYLDIEFMHKGLPRMNLKAKWTPPALSAPVIPDSELADDIIELTSSLNICSNEFKARQYDHEVKGISVIKPFVGKYRDVQSDATVSMPEPCSREGIILSYGILPSYSDIDTYHMMASVIDLAVRRIVAVGGNTDMIAGLDNFCWPDPVASEKTPDGEYKLAQLVRANKALYDYTKAFKTPCISGKDSMKNDCHLGGVKISIPPTVLFSAVSKMDDISKAVTLDAKFADDTVYVIGVTKPELGGSEYLALKEQIGDNVPKVDADSALKTYRAVSKLTDKCLVNSLHTPALGGLAAGFAKVALGGRLGIDIDLKAVPVSEPMTDKEILFSESNSRFIMTISPKNSEAVEAILNEAGVPFAEVGKVTDKQNLNLSGNSKVSIALNDIINNYKSPLDGV